MRAIAITDYQIFKTIDGGIKWTEINIPLSIYERYLWDCSYPDKNTIYLYSESLQHESNVLLRSNDGGKSWNIPYERKSSCSIFFIDSINGWILPYKPDLTDPYGMRKYDNILFTSDGGVNWVLQLDELGTPSNGLKGIIFYNKKLGFAYGDSSKILRTTDGGMNWFKDYLAGHPPKKNIMSIAANSSSSAFAFCWDGSIFKWISNINGINVNLNDLKNNFSITPNPASDLITLRFGKLVQSAIEQDLAIEIYNTFGVRMLKEIFLPPFSKREIEVDVSVLPAGMYLVRAVISSEVELAMFVKW